MPLQLLAGRGDGALADVSSSAGSPSVVARLGRALAAGDIDNDGRVDAVVIDHNSPMVDLRNRTETTGRWLVLRLEGRSSNRDAVGAVVAVTSGARTWYADRFGGGGYQSAGDSRLHFGLGDHASLASVKIL
jgi:hypothetical protein